MRVAAAKSGKSEAKLLDQATGNLLRAVKQKMLKKQGSVDYDKLRKDGYSDRFLAKLEEA
ncbi:MAG TPA: hypothetical protein VIJ24_00685 [Verrucomicrobiae bacterium]